MDKDEHGRVAPYAVNLLTADWVAPMIFRSNLTIINNLIRKIVGVAKQSEELRCVYCFR